MDIPKVTQLYLDSLEPRWFYGVKSFSETSIGSVPAAIANAIYNACGVRIREHPITRDKIMAGLKANLRKTQRQISRSQSQRGPQTIFPGLKLRPGSTPPSNERTIATPTGDMSSLHHCPCST